MKNTIYDYATQFGENIDYYLEQIYGIIISYQDINDYDCDDLYRKKVYLNSINEDILDNYLYNEYYDWFDKNKEKLGLIEG